MSPEIETRTDGVAVRDPNPDSAKDLYRIATKAAVLGLVINFALGVIKLIGGVVGNSFALISDAINSLGDSLTSVVVLGGLWYSQQPADEEHPYGHTRAEAVAASNVAVLIIISALLVGWEAISRFFEAQSLPAKWTLWIAGSNVVIKEALYRYKLRVGKRTGSAAITASAWDHRCDALCSLAVLIGLGIIHWAGPDYIWIDEVAALIVVAAILWSSTGLYRTSTSELLDPQADEKLLAEVRQIAAEVQGVREVEKLWVRKTGLEYLADIHIQVDAHLSVEEGHRIGHLVKDRLVAEFASLRDVLVHLEPYSNSHDQKSS